MKALKNFSGRKGPLVLVVLDGVAIGEEDNGNAVHLARTPVLDSLKKESVYCELQAHGTAVGLPSDKDMGNSEVGHNAIGAGQIYDQGAKLVSEAIDSQQMFMGSTWQELTQNCTDKNTCLHFIGLLSDGNVHSHIKHLLAMLTHASTEGVVRVRVHCLLDGRDVSEISAIKYIDMLEEHLQQINSQQNCDYKIASGGGRMHITMDRYGADWKMVERGWHAHVLGKGRAFSSAKEAITTFRQENSEITDQFLPSFVVHDDKGAVGEIKDDDSVVFFNFRGDRALEITQAFTMEFFDKFDRERYPKVKFAGMMQYDGDSKTPEKFLVEPPLIRNTLGEFLATNGFSQFAVSETQKYGHVTYFWNGNRFDKFSETLETYQEIPSDTVSFEQRPWMKAAEITDAAIDNIEKYQTKFTRLNYPNGDMIGHTGDINAATIAVSAVDLCLGRLLKFIAQKDGVAIVLADHGNADEMYEKDGQGNFIRNEQTQKLKNKTSHTLNPVPFAIFDPHYNNEYKINNSLAKKGLSNVAATVVNLLGYEPPSEWQPSLIVFE
ncbi:2,3-bisphosphoglycerate-independent phosphoglycerate mutase [Candidatus Uabimicrobium sp. HlEnr_7]|uniref:2,3-bisphosphoglycerate-independent phosphoglycerate mutase n=1 Tax=Candidatus Uabimicrobium helgolandensis TaxID=3095367 RepID=UPI003555EB38